MRRRFLVPLSLFGSTLACGPPRPSADDGMTTTAAEGESETDDPTTSTSSETEETSTEETSTEETSAEEDGAECHDDGDCPPESMCVAWACVPALPKLEECASLELVTTVVYSLSFPYGYRVGDIDGLPGDEIVAAHEGEIVSIAAGVVTVAMHDIPDDIRDVELLHADADGHADLIITRWGAYPRLLEFLGDGLGGFVADGYRPGEWGHSMARAAASPSDVLVVGTNFDQHVFVDALASEPTLELSSESVPVTGDFDGDGVDELVTSSWSEMRIWVRAGDTYELAQTLDCYVEGFEFFAIPVIGDVDADGRDDVVCFNEELGVAAVTLWTSLGALEFSRQPDVRVDADISGIGGDATGVVANLEGDDVPELVFGSDDVRFLRLGDDGNFGCQQLLFGVSDGPLVGDLDADGREELVSVNSGEVIRVHAVP